MQPYVSPISFLPVSTTPLSAKDIKLAKQKLMAEFELAGTTTIPVGNKELSRNDVLKLFDQLELANDLDYHALVATDPVLLRFLEHYEIKPGNAFSLQEDKITDEFVEWITPYYSWAFKKATTRMFRNVNPEEFETLVVCPILMNDNDEWEAWGGVDTYLQLTLENFRIINNVKYHSSAQSAQYASYNFIWLLCNLPEDRFSQLLNNYAFEIMRLAIKEFNTNNRDYAFEILGYAKSLRISDDMMLSLQNKEKEMAGIQKKQKSSKANRNLWNYIRIAFLIIMILSRLATCNGATDNNDNNVPIHFIAPK